MSMCFHLVMATWTLGALCREKALSELPNGSMVKMAQVALAHKVTNSPIKGSQPLPPINFIADSIYFNGIVPLTIWIVYSSNWNGFRLRLNMSASILKHFACHIWISLTRMSSPLRTPQNICGMVILSIYIAFSVRNSSLTD